MLVSAKLVGSYLVHSSLKRNKRKTCFLLSCIAIPTLKNLIDMLFKTVFFILGHAAARPTDTQSMPADEIANQGTEPVLPGVDFSRAPFGGKCRRISLTGGGKVGKTTLEGLCADEKGREWVTGLNLNQCIGNNAGKMVYKDGWVFWFPEMVRWGY